MRITPLDSLDAMIWNLNSKGVFTVKSYYFKLLSYSPLPMKLVLFCGSLGKLFAKFSSPEGVGLCVGGFPR